MRKRKLEFRRFLAGTLILAIIILGCPNLFGKDMVSVAQGNSLVETPSEQHEAAWQTEDGVWQFGTFAEAVENVSPQGQVVLLSDVSLTSGITISKAVLIVSNEEGKPRTIRNMEPDTDDKKECGRIFTVTGGELRLQNIILDGRRNEGVTACHPLICVSGAGACLRMLDGAVLQNTENGSQSMCGGGINIRKGQAFMYAGSRITNCRARHGGGIEINTNTNYAQAMFGMAGGSIDDCQADNGGGVYVNSGMFQMQGGEIKGNRAVKVDDGGQRTGGGAIYVAGGTDSTKVAAVLVGAGRITDNEALSNGGGILVQGGYAQIEMRGGTVEGNTAKNGGGISVIWGTLMLHGGTVTGNRAGLYGGGILGCPDSVIQLKANPRVFENVAGDTTDRFDNFYLDGAEDEDPSWATRPIQITGPLTEGVQLEMSRWVRPDEQDHPYREMFVSGKGYEISQDDFNRLCSDKQSSHKELYAENMEKYALIPYEGKIVMVLAAHIALDRDRLSLEKAGDTASLTATVTPDNAPVKEVTWSSSNESVATVDAGGKVTAVGEGKAIIQATTVSPYHETASCNVTVGKFYHRLTTMAEYGQILYTSTSIDAEGRIEENQQITLQFVPDPGYQLKDGSLRAYQTGNESVPVAIKGDAFSMPDYNVTVTAVFEPVSYAIICHLEGGAFREGETNPDHYTIEDSEITLSNPIRSGYRFVGWLETGHKETELIVKIPSGSVGAREYTAVWEEDKPAVVEPTPGATDTSSTPTPAPGATDNPSSPTPTPGATDNPTGETPTPAPGGTMQPGTATPAPGATDNPSGETPTPGATDNPSGEIPTPGATEAPSTPTPAPEGSTQPGTVTQVPGGMPQPDTEPPAASKSPVLDESGQTGNQIEKRKDLSILLAVGKQKGKTSICLTWLPYKGTSGYEVYWSYCDGKRNFKKLKTVKALGKRAFVHKKLKKDTAYKYYIAAYKMTDGKKQYIAKSPVIHVAMKYEKRTNVKKITVNKAKVTLWHKKKFQIKAKTVLWDRKKKGINHAPLLRYYTKNKKVVTVSKKGKITAKGKGTCTVYVIANNGVVKKIKVKVKN